MQPITSIASFAYSNKPCCVLSMTSHIQFLQQNYPKVDIFIVPSTRTIDLFEARSPTLKPLSSKP